MSAWIEAWVQVAWSEELGERPLGRRVADRPLVLFRGRDGRATALDAVCPHRGGDLAVGALDDGCVSCPYHGWRFDAEGRCVSIPSQPPDAPIPARANAMKFATIERDDAVWCWLGAGAPVFAPPARRYPGAPSRRVRARPQVFEAGFVDVVEQAIDASHHPFVHRGAMGRSQPARVPAIELDASDDALCWRYRSEDEPEAGPRGIEARLRRALLGLDRPTRWSYRFELGGLLQLDIGYPDGTWELNSLAFAPRDARSTWVFAENARTRAPHLFAELHQRYFLLRVLDEDRRAARLLLGRREDGFPADVSVRADRATLAFRRLWARQRPDPNDHPASRSQS
jgi:phenylpropionate dioxygenase-like ring-hydroxylating dioxygenase large terminal subunit